MVREFDDVFLDELPEMPPNQEFEFSIKLMLGTLPLFKTPYCMAPMEMKELKVQLQELLNKGFIKTSTLP